MTGFLLLLLLFQISVVSGTLQLSPTHTPSWPLRVWSSVTTSTCPPWPCLIYMSRHLATVSYIFQSQLFVNNSAPWKTVIWLLDWTVCQHLNMSQLPSSCPTLVKRYNSRPKTLCPGLACTTVRNWQDPLHSQNRVLSGVANITPPLGLSGKPYFPLQSLSRKHGLTMHSQPNLIPSFLYFNNMYSLYIIYLVINYTGFWHLLLFSIAIWIWVHFTFHLFTSWLSYFNHMRGSHS